MTDYLEEQRNEVEALASIYPEEFTIISEDPYCFQIQVKSEIEGTEEEDDDNSAEVTLEFLYTPTYPDEAPIIDIPASFNLLTEDTDLLITYLNEQASENLGMVMIFTLVSEAQEKLNVKLDEVKARREEEKKRLEEEEEAKRKEEEKPKFVGTPVTIENFLAWKKKFDEEQVDISIKQVDGGASKLKLTGRQLFEMDGSMDMSDAVLLEEGEGVVVDESLFQYLDDLDLEDEDLQ